ncbi:MAG: DUF805 domain-containing protein [Peptococcaceae bacterium]|nr:DUF805 domain-containing protein [Peptococcaceae bacterium]
MTEWLNMWKNYVNFSDRTNLRGYWMAFAVNFVASMILGTIASMNPALLVLCSLYGLASFLPGLGIAIRRLRDAGKGWANIFWVFLPLIGTIIIIILLCKPSIAEDGVPVV